MGREQEFRRALPSEHHAAVFDVIAGTWVSVPVAVAYYRACEELGLSNEEQVDNGRSVGVQIRGTFAGTLVHMSKEVGFGPWNLIPAMPRLWGRIFDGSTLRGWKLGPKEARVEVSGMALADLRYFRNALRGQVMGMLDLACTRSYVNAWGGTFPPGTYSLRLQWA
jgi:hypothetical protein